MSVVMQSMRSLQLEEAWAAGEAVVAVAQAYLEARDELTEREDAHRELVDAYELNPGDLDAAEQALTRAAEREMLARARLRAEVLRWA